MKNDSKADLSLEELLGKNPIHIPLNPLVDTGIRFGRDELLAMIFNTSATVIANFILTRYFPTIDRLFLLSIVGPVVEKIGLLSWYFRGIFHKGDKGSTFFKRTKNAMKESLPTLAEDVLLHDPIYSGMLYFGQVKYSDTPIWILTLIVFLISVTIVAVLELVVEHLRYCLFRLNLFRAGFKEEVYFESRFYIPSNIDPTVILDDVAKRFNLVPNEKILYEDRYFTSRDMTFLRKDFLIRSRYRKRNGMDFSTLQFVFTRPQAINTSGDKSSYNYYPSKKIKLYYTLKSETKDTKDLPKGIRKITKKFQNLEKPRYICFDRAYAHDEELLVSLDLGSVEGASFRVVEVKVYKDLKKLEEAMAYILQHYPVEQTTYGKNSIVGF